MNPPRLPRCHWRYADAPMPAEQADNIRRGRVGLARLLALLLILGAMALLAYSMAAAPPASIPF